MSASRTGRGEIKELVALTHSRKLQAHEKVNKALAKNIEELKINKVRKKFSSLLLNDNIIRGTSS